MCFSSMKKTGHKSWWFPDNPFLFVKLITKKSSMISKSCWFFCLRFSVPFGDVTITGEGLQILTYARYSLPLSSESSLACHTYQNNTQCTMFVHKVNLRTVIEDLKNLFHLVVGLSTTRIALTGDWLYKGYSVWWLVSLTRYIPCNAKWPWVSSIGLLI